jgi:Domain of unknown function (DUF6398)
MVDLVGLKVPNAMRAVVEEIVDVTDTVCLAVLDEEYADLARQMVAKLARKRPSPLTAGRRVTWAAGVVYALGQANFLFDPASQPGVTAGQLSEAFGVAKNTMGAKARQVRDLLRISPFSPEFQRADVVARNPMVWIISVDGLAMDARHVSLTIQEEAFDRGLIPYIPALGPDGTAARAEARMPEAARGAARPPEQHDLLEHCAGLKRQLVEFCVRRFSREFDEAARERADGVVPDETESVNLIDHFILQQPLVDGRTVVEAFVSEHPELADADCRILLGWREVVEGIFEIRQLTSRAVIAANLVDGRTYQICVIAGSAALTVLWPGCFMTARVVPLGSDWMFAGAQRLYPPSEREAILQLAAEQATGDPQRAARHR